MAGTWASSDLQHFDSPASNELRHLGEDPKDFIGRSLMQVFNIAEETYDELPEFWRIWKEWHAPQPRTDMGDL